MSSTTFATLADVNHAEIRRAEVDLSTMGQDIIDDLRALVPDREVRFEAEPGIKAHGDRTLVRILLTNLLQNAWKYTGPSVDAWIELGVVEEEDDVPIYHVRDNGIGFDNASCEANLPSLRAAPYQDRVLRSGLGLATVERIVHRHGGRCGPTVSWERGRSSASHSDLRRQAISGRRPRLIGLGQGWHVADTSQSAWSASLGSTPSLVEVARSIG